MPPVQQNNTPLPKEQCLTNGSEDETTNSGNNEEESLLSRPTTRDIGAASSTAPGLLVLIGPTLLAGCVVVEPLS